MHTEALSRSIFAELHRAKQANDNAVRKEILKSVRPLVIQLARTAGATDSQLQRILTFLTSNIDSAEEELTLIAIPNNADRRRSSRRSAR